MSKNNPLFQHKRGLILNEDEYWVHYKGWNKNKDEIVHAEIMKKVELDKLPVRKSKKPEIKPKTAIKQKPEEKIEIVAPEKPLPKKRIRKRKNLDFPEPAKKQPETKKLKVILEKISPSQIKPTERKKPVKPRNGKSKLKWNFLLEKRKIIKALTDRGESKKAIEDVLSKCEIDINNYVRRTIKRHLGNIGEYREIEKNNLR